MELYTKELQDYKCMKNKKAKILGHLYTVCLELWKVGAAVIFCTSQFFQIWLSNIHDLSVCGKLNFVVHCGAKYPMMWCFETLCTNSAFYFCFPGEKTLPKTGTIMEKNCKCCFLHLHKTFYFLIGISAL